MTVHYTLLEDAAVQGPNGRDGLLKDTRVVLAADYDHLLEVARDIAENMNHTTDHEPDRPPRFGHCGPCLARALIDPATPEPVEGEKTLTNDAPDATGADLQFLKGSHPHPQRAICPTCGENLMRVGIHRIVYAFEVCEDPPLESKHVYEQMWHRACFHRDGPDVGW